MRIVKIEGTEIVQSNLKSQPRHQAEIKGQHKSTLSCYNTHEKNLHTHFSS